MSKVTKERKISKPAGTEAGAPPVSASVAIAGMFAPDDFQMPKGTEINSMSPMIRPVDFPTGRKLVGKLTKLFQTTAGKNDDKSDKFGVGIEIIPDGFPVGIALPATNLIERALKIKNSHAAGVQSECPYLGRYIVIEKMPNRIPSKKGNDAWNFVIGILPEDFTMQTLPA